MIIEPLLTKIIDGREFVEISNHAAKGVKKQGYMICSDGTIFSLISNQFMIIDRTFNDYPVRE